MIEKLKKYLDEHQINYMLISHSPAYTAPEIAASAHIPGKEMVKTVMIKIDDKLAMAVLPAARLVDFQQLKEAIGARVVNLAAEIEFQGIFPDSESGAMPPFGNLYNLDVYLDRQLAEDEKISFNAGNFQELVQMSFADYEKLVKPRPIYYSRVQHNEKRRARPISSG